ncbi:LysR substrate-binding domain-containing protein [Desertivirga xinjiangensis]|uniref:LysR substrate-binding domain-containing protein n=1 Tax=Desertivirga xinjiangensis TaxID=539206 RepID=UPI00210B5BA7|nr:LysR substrate-binding domain-containing protein [Pedobacter xinjiangensis]
MADFRLEVFYTVARRLSFTKAAHELFITQPAVTKHIHELEEEYQAKLFERNGNRIALTQAGSILLKHTEQIFSIYRQAKFEINTISNRSNGILRLGASTTISQYLIPPLLAQFHDKFPGIRINLINGNTELIEQALIKKEIDLGLIEGHTKNPQISYSEFVKDEIVLVCSNKHPLAKSAEIRLEQLQRIPLILRERGSGTLEVLEHFLEPLKLKLSDLQIEMQLGSTEAIKSYLSHSSCVAFISIHAILRELNSGELRIIDVAGLNIDRFFYLIHLHGMVDGLSDIFIKFSNLFRNRK